LAHPLQRPADLEKLRLYYLLFNSSYEAHRLEQHIKMKEITLDKISSNTINESFNLSQLIDMAHHLSLLGNDDLLPLISLIEQIRKKEDQESLIDLLHQIQKFI